MALTKWRTNQTWTKARQLLTSSTSGWWNWVLIIRFDKNLRAQTQERSHKSMSLEKTTSIDPIIATFQKRSRTTKSLHSHM
jgi:hypothetical protein